MSENISLFSYLRFVKLRSEMMLSSKSIEVILVLFINVKQPHQRHSSKTELFILMLNCLSQIFQCQSEGFMQSFEFYSY